MNLRQSICILCLLIWGAPAPAQDSGNPKQQAKQLAEKAAGEGGDRAPATDRV
jgi:hypothetical protein